MFNFLKCIMTKIRSSFLDHNRESNILVNRYRDVEAQLELKNHRNQTLESNNSKMKMELKDWKGKCEQQGTVDFTKF